jgi:hypothetical protein
MKLRTFENYSSDSFYRKIEVEDFIDYFEKFVNFTPRNFLKLKSILEPHVVMGKSDIASSEYMNHRIQRGYFHINRGSEIDIYELPDEYWIILLDLTDHGSKSYERYLCDQWDGVIKLLKDHKIIP